MIYVNLFLKISLGLIKFDVIAFPSILLKVCFLIMLLLPKQTNFTTMKLAKQRNY